MYIYTSCGQLKPTDMKMTNKVVQTLILVLGFTVNVFSQSPNEEFNQSEKFLEEGKSNLKNGYWYDGYYFYKSLEHLANYAELESDNTKIIGQLYEINSQGQIGNDNYISFTQATLPKISTSYQKRLNTQIDSLQSIIKDLEGKTDFDKKNLLKKYIELIELQQFDFNNGKFNGYEYKRSLIKRAKLEIEVGNVNSGCELLYETDLLYFHNYGFASKDCSEWYKVKSAADTKEYEEEQKANAEKWYSDNPNIIKLRSLIGESYTTVEAYLGEPLAENYRIDAGVGIYSQQFIGNKYKNEQGVYEIGFKNGNVITIQFFPNNFIKYSPETFDSESSMFDMEGGIDGTCFGETKDNHIGDIKMFSIDFDCSSSGLVSTVFYGRNGKLLSVLAY